MTPEFTSLVNPTLHYVLDLTSRMKGGGAQVDLKLERGQIRNVLRQAEEKAARLGGRARRILNWPANCSFIGLTN